MSGRLERKGKRLKNLITTCIRIAVFLLSDFHPTAPALPQTIENRQKQTNKKLHETLSCQIKHRLTLQGTKKVHFLPIIIFVDLVSVLTSSLSQRKVSFMILVDRMCPSSETF